MVVFITAADVIVAVAVILEGVVGVTALAVKKGEGA